MLCWYGEMGHNNKMTPNRVRSCSLAFSKMKRHFDTISKRVSRIFIFFRVQCTLNKMREIVVLVSHILPFKFSRTRVRHKYFITFLLMCFYFWMIHAHKSFVVSRSMFVLNPRTKQQWHFVNEFHWCTIWNRNVLLRAQTRTSACKQAGIVWWLLALGKHCFANIALQQPK